MSLDQLLRAAVALSEQDRRALLDSLPDDGIDDTIDHDGPDAPRAYTDEEITAISRQRLDDYDAGRVGSVPGE